MEAKLFTDLLPKFEDFYLDIHTASSIGCDERVRDIIENSESKSIVDEYNKKGWTPLMYAACCANLNVVILLLEEGAKANIRNREGHTALILASKCGSGDVVNLLIDSGADINNRDLRAWTALFYAAAFGHTSVVQLLIERGAAADIVDDNGVTPLMLAAAAGHERIVHELLQLGVSITAESKSGETARTLAIKNNHLNVKSLMDSYQQLKRRSNVPSVRSPDLATLLKNLNLTKYYHLFESHDIDLNTFWLLNDDDLKEIGIQLIGPRKKMCMAISQYHQEHSQKNSSKEATNLDNVLIENKKLRHSAEKLKAMMLQEKNARMAAERNLAEGIRSLKDFNEMYNSTVSQMTVVLEKLKENQEFVRSQLCAVFQDVRLSNAHLKPKVDSIFQLLERMQKIIDLQLQNMTPTQKANFHK